MSATILHMPRKKPRKRAGVGPRSMRLADLTRAVRELVGTRPHADELAVLLLYVKQDPPAHQLAAELSISQAEAAGLLRMAASRLNADPAFRDAFHLLNSRLC